MRICIITSYSAAGWGGGVATHLMLLVKGLTGAGCEVTLISGVHRQGGFSPEQFKGAKCEAVEGVAPDALGFQFWQKSRDVFMKLHREKPFDIVLSEGTSAYGLLKDKSIKVPVVGMLHQFKFIHLFNSLLGVRSLRTLGVYILKTFPRIIYDAFSKEIGFYRGCKGVICGAEHIARQIKRFYRISSSKIKVIPYWLDENRFKPDIDLKDSARKDLGLAQDSIVFLILSRIQATKGIDTGLKAFAKAADKMPQACLLVAGGGREDLLSSYKEMAKDLNIDKKTLFTGMAREESLSSLYNAADVFVMPSPLIEVLPYTVLEAMACGRPVVTTKRPGNYEALGDSGIYVDSGDSSQLAEAMGRLYADSSLREDLAARALKRFKETFIREDLVEKFIGFLKEVKTDDPR